MAFKYTKKVIEHFTKPRNTGEIKKPDAKATEGSPACGDMLTFTLKVDPKTKKITEIKFKSYGCASNIATASVLTTLVKGKTIEQAKKIKHEDVTKKLGELPQVKIHCSILAVETLKAAIKDYEDKH